MNVFPEEHIEKRGIRDPEVLAALRATPREEFVPEECRPFVYEDRPLGIGYGVTISQPYIVAAMTQLLEAKPEHRVLEIGTGSGYQAAILARLVLAVYSIEVIPELSERAAGTLSRLGIANVFVRQGDGNLGWPEQAPFDRIILTAAPSQIPPLLLDQLRPGGRLLAPVGKGENQNLLQIDKSLQGRYSERSVFPVSFVPLVQSR